MIKLWITIKMISTTNQQLIWVARYRGDTRFAECVIRKSIKQFELENNLIKCIYKFYNLQAKYLYFKL